MFNNDNVVYDRAIVLHAKYKFYLDQVYVPGCSLVRSAVGSKTSVPTIEIMPIVLLTTIQWRTSTVSCRYRTILLTIEKLCAQTWA